MATLAQARQDLADVLNTVAGVDVRPRPIPTPRSGDGWVVVTRVEAADFRACAAALTAVLCLGPDEAKAEQLLEQLAVPLVDAVTRSALNTSDLVLEPQTLVTGITATPLYVLAITVTIEVGG